MIDIYEIYLDIRTFWFSFGLMDSPSRRHVIYGTDHNEAFEVYIKPISDDLFIRLNPEPICRIRTYFGSCIFPAPHFSY